MRVLHATSGLDGGGVERLLFDYYNNMDHSKIQFDFVKSELEEGILEEPLRKMGCKIYTVPPMRKDFKGYCRTMREILTENHYDVIHCSGGFKAAKSLQIAKQCGVPVRIAHSHICEIPESGKQRLVRWLVTKFTKYYATDLFACGKKAAEWMWGEKALRNGQVHIMNNAIYTDKFAFNEQKRNEIRKELGVDGKFVIGNVGRLSYQKNHEFLIEVFAEVRKQWDDAVLLLIGRGELEEEMRAQAAKLAILDSVRFLGVRKDVPDLLNAMDLFVLPSRFEGLPVTLVEVQANGLPALVSDTVTDEMRLNGNVEYLPLKVDEWSMRILSGRFLRNPDGKSNISNGGYDILKEAQNLTAFYEGKT